MRLFLALIAMNHLVGQDARADTCDAYGQAVSLTEVDAPVIDESSGIVRARTRDGVWFTHNDAGGEAEIFSFTLDGTFMQAHEVEGASFRDWEDIAAGPCPTTGKHACLYIGDIGDNAQSREDITIYVVEEPGAGASAEVVATYTATYPDGPENSESLVVHPCTGRIYLVTKTASATSTVYRFPEKENGELEWVAELAFGKWYDSDPLTTGADWEEDGDRLIIRTYRHAYEWITDPHDADGHWADTPTQMALIDSGVSEGIGYDADGSIITSIEGVPMVLNRIPCKAQSETRGCSQPDTGTPDSGSADTAPPDSGSGGSKNTDTKNTDTGSGDSGTPGNANPADGTTEADEDTESSTASSEKCGCGGGAAWLLLPVLARWRRRPGLCLFGPRKDGEVDGHG